jgi:hypothetical protein
MRIVLTVADFENESHLAYFCELFNVFHRFVRGSAMSLEGDP